jgi:hypothetical protein
MCDWILDTDSEDKIARIREVALNEDRGGPSRMIKAKRDLLEMLG